MISAPCKKTQCEDCETYQCKCPCHFDPTDEEILEAEDGEGEDIDVDSEESENLFF